MIELTKLSKKPFFLNCELIESVEEKPDTTITLFNGRKYIVREKAEEVIKKILLFKRTAYDLNASMAKYAEGIENKNDENDDCETC